MKNLLKIKKREAEKISGEIIPTLLSEMGLSSLKLADGSAVEVKTVLCSQHLFKE